MSDRFPGQIWIGGQLSRSARLFPDDPDDDTTILQGLIGALVADGGSHDWGEAPISNSCTEAELLDYVQHKGVHFGVLHLKDDLAVNGEFQETEEFCIEHDIPFDRNSDHYCDYDGENAYWRPGMNAPFVTYADSSGQEIVSGEVVREALAELIKYKIQAVFEQLDKAISLLKNACPELPDKLESFKIVD